MPEIKNTFLKGKMNKSLDDRLLPEGEYRDALNVQITKAEGEDIGAAHNILGNLSIKDLGLSANAKCIGVASDDKRNAVYAFFADDASNNHIYEIRPNETPVGTSLLASGSFLNFDETKYITAINIIEDQLFWSDGINQPRVIDIAKAKNGDITYDSEVKVAVAKYSPFETVTITGYANVADNPDYIKEKFVRFSYRYKFKDNKYSQIAPFSQIAFDLENDSIQDAAEVEEIYKFGILKNFVNHANQVTMDVPLPSNAIDTYQIDSVEILMKDANSPAVRKLTSIDVTTSHQTANKIVYEYNSEIPTGTLQEADLLRVTDILPVKAEAQEVISNRVVYGNYQTYKYDAPAVDYTVSLVDKQSSLDTAYPQHFLKSRREYEVGLVFSDLYGRKSPVITLPGNSVKVDAVDDSTNLDSYRGKQIKVTVNGSIDNAFDASTNPLGWHSYRVVVKQPQQDYYNVYLPTCGRYLGKTYISLHGDNVNKVPRNTDNILEGEQASSNVRLYPKVLNQSGFIQMSFPYEITDGKIPYTGYEIHNHNTSTDVAIGGYVSGKVQSFTGSDLTDNYPIVGQKALQLSRDWLFAEHSNHVTEVKPSGVYVFINGKLQLENSIYTTGKHTYSTNSTYGEVWWYNANAPAATDKIDIILRFDTISQDFNTSNIIYKSLGLVYRKYGPPQDDVEITLSTANNGDLIFSDSDPDPLSEAYAASNNPPTQSNGDIVKVLAIGEFSTFEELYSSTIVNHEKVGIYQQTPSTLIAQLDTNDSDIDPILNLGIDLSVFETEPFISALDIYYETQTTGEVSEFANADTVPVELNVEFFNSFIVKGDYTGTNNYMIEESRIRGDFNSDQVDIGVIAHIENEDFSVNNRPNGLIYSGIYNGNTGVNNTNVFSSAQSITRAVDIQYGGIYKLFAEDTNLNIFQEQRVSSALIDKDAIYTAEGGAITTNAQNVIGQIIPYGTNYGIGKNPESFAYYAGRKYFVDPNKNAVLRLSRDGITDISNYGMSSYFRDLLENYTGSILGCYDVYNKEYVLNANSVTVGYDESVKGWTSRYSYQPENIVSLQGKFYSLKNDELYEHYHADADRGTFYGTFTASEIELVFNAGASSNKVFQSLSYEGTPGWSATSISTDSDIALSVSAYTNTGMDTDVTFHVSKFKKQAGKYHSVILNTTTAGDNEVLFGEEISGIKGFFTKLTMKTSDTVYRELFAVSSNYNINSY